MWVDAIEIDQSQDKNIQWKTLDLSKATLGNNQPAETMRRRCPMELATVYETHFQEISMLCGCFF